MAIVYQLPVKAADPDPESLAIGAAIDAAFAAGRASVLGTPSPPPRLRLLDAADVADESRDLIRAAARR